MKTKIAIGIVALAFAAAAREPAEREIMAFKILKPSWTLADLVFLRGEAGVAIDAETLAEVRLQENVHRDIAACLHCGAVPFDQHQLSCPRSSILFANNWFEILTRGE